MNRVIPKIMLEDRIASAVLGYKKPALIIEGDTDEKVYSRALMQCDVDIDEYDIIIGNGKKNIIQHIESGMNFQYVALLDKDHDEYLGIKYENENIIYTDFYDMENYLTDDCVVYQVYKELKNIWTQDYTKEEIVLNMNKIISQLYIAIKFKLHYLMNGNIQNLYDVRTLYNDKWWDKLNRKVVEVKLENFITEYCDRNGILFDRALWQQYQRETANKQRENAILDDVPNVINGKIVREAYFEWFKEEGLLDNKSDINTFTTLLITQINCSRCCLNLIDTVSGMLGKLGCRLKMRE